MCLVNQHGMNYDQGPIKSFIYPLHFVLIQNENLTVWSHIDFHINADVWKSI